MNRKRSFMRQMGSNGLVCRASFQREPLAQPATEAVLAELAMFADAVG